MPIIGRYPESGLRIDISRPRGGGPPWRYEGEAATADAHFPMRATVAEDGTVGVDIDDVGDARAPAGTADAARLIVRAALKHARDEDEHGAPPRRIQRWRAAK